jgi:hypothetical protein
MLPGFGFVLRSTSSWNIAVPSTDNSANRRRNARNLAALVRQDSRTRGFAHGRVRHGVVVVIVRVGLPPPRYLSDLSGPALSAFGLRLS